MLDNIQNHSAANQLLGLMQLVSEKSSLLPELRARLEGASFYFLLESNQSAPYKKLATVWLEPGKKGLSKILGFTNQDDARRFCAAQDGRFKFEKLKFSDVRESLDGNQKNFDYTFAFSGKRYITLPAQCLHAICDDQVSLPDAQVSFYTSSIANIKRDNLIDSNKELYDCLIEQLNSRFEESSCGLTAYLVEVNDSLSDQPSLLLLINLDNSKEIIPDSCLHKDLMFILSNSAFTDFYESFDICYVPEEDDRILKRLGIKPIN